ncbi:glutamate-5-semialdehyde dehydrogenase [Arenibacter sp. GZD96]|uniref:glutamate-5-semialdehyde dehydrogenase n=1 Tax=Aurantibrevibacter litoralis TaxID=3106030 RepID=UPI002AFF28E7|nr:glutamate-5-semialdehyde dehydrogenase [Arenibacter sp. GZD-96]MEA1785570.1 glutamate-5-semialdehyde dehydrogenase [Arenibacter sp. GZD-96]
MSLPLTIEQRNAVLDGMARLLDRERNAILEANQKDMQGYKGGDLAMRDRLLVNHAKIDGMILSLEQLIGNTDPLGIERYQFSHENGMKVSNRTAPFGTVLIIYESRPDVTVEAAGIAFKSGNKIVLKGGKESLNSNLLVVDLWHQALSENDISSDWISYLKFNRAEIQAYLEKPPQKIDLIVPRGGEQLISFVKQHATCPVIVSGRGNNFAYVDTEADVEKAIDIIINAKTTKISACNALDKVLIAADLPRKHEFLHHVVQELKKKKVAIFTDSALTGFEGTSPMPNAAMWYEEFLDYKIVLGQVPDLETAIDTINQYAGGHSASILTENETTARIFMDAVDSAAVYHNVSTRFTDGGQFGLGGELAIGTDKLHQRGPIGLQHLVTNKWYIFGNGQVR